MRTRDLQQSMVSGHTRDKQHQIVGNKDNKRNKIMQNIAEKFLSRCHVAVIKDWISKISYIRDFPGHI